MKFNIPLLTSLLLLTPTFTAMGASQMATGCAAKRQNIEQQIEYARAHGNTYRVEGLGIALAKLNANCTNEGLRADRESDVRKKEHKVKKARQELAEARSDGRQDKIDKRQRKLAEAQAELNEARAAIQK